MKQEIFTFEELQEMQTIVLRGGTSDLPHCNDYVGCGYNNKDNQYNCINAVIGCNYGSVAKRCGEYDIISNAPNQ